MFVIFEILLSSVAQGEPLTNEGLIAFWQNLYPSQNRASQPVYGHEMLAKATPDECFYGIGDSRNDYLASSCPNPGVLKVNETVIWGLVQSGDKLWFGTLANSRCTSGGDPIYGPTPFANDLLVCEFGESKISPPFPDPFGDWRPPAIYVYRLGTRELQKKMYLFPTSMGGLPIITGIRGGGSLDGIVFLGGGSGVPKTPLMGVTLLAFDSETETFLGWHELKDPQGQPYINIRPWKAHNGHLYVGVWKEGGGRILRWLGDPEAIKKGDLRTLWQFEEVGRVDQQPANMSVYEGRLVVGTWPMENSGQTADLYNGGAVWLSPPFDDHLTSQDVDKWVRVWSYAEYEPNLTNNLTNGIGALHEYGGYLWWGTQQPPGRGWLAHKEFYAQKIPGYPNETQDAAAFYGTWRPTSLFRGRHLGTADQEVEIVYGFEFLPTFVMDTGTPYWELRKNKMGKKPLWGPGGFGNFYLFYTYSMGVQGGRLLIGTNEISLRFAVQETPFPMPVPSDKNLWGAELWRIDNAEMPAVAETIDGFGGFTSTSMKSIIVSSEAVYLAVGNPHNLLTNSDDAVPDGGWELWALRP